MVDGGLDHRRRRPMGDRKSTRLNSSHSSISYAVFCLKKKIVTNTMNHCANEVSSAQHTQKLQVDPPSLFWTATPPHQTSAPIQLVQRVTLPRKRNMVV